MNSTKESTKESETIIHLNENERTELLEVLKNSSLPDQNKQVVIMIVTQYFKLFQLYQSGHWKFKRFLFRFFGSKTEKDKPGKNNPPQPKNDGKNSERKKEAEPSNKDPRAGGRKPHDDYEGAKRVTIDHESLKPGNLCPCCKVHRLYEFGHGSVLVLCGQAPVGATRYEPQQLRCSGCEHFETAKLPDSIKKEELSAHASVALYNYGAGLPFYRLQGLQSLFGIPLSDSKQWMMVKELFNSVFPLYLGLTEQASRGTHFFNDDTGQRVLSEKKKLQTSAVVSLFETHKISLFYTGYKDAGQNLETIISLRESIDLPLQMADASSRSLMRELDAIVCYCLDHARRKIFELKTIFNIECEWILNKLKSVYKNEKESRGLSSEERLFFHQERSIPVMNEINEYLQEKFENKEVEPNSELGKAFSYFLNHWNQLTQFLRIAGACLSNGEAERAIKKVALKRKNSQVYKTLFGAFVGDVIMSIIETARNSKINVLEYLTQLQMNEKAVAIDPLKWLPWNYQLNISTS